MPTRPSVKGSGRIENKRMERKVEERRRKDGKKMRGGMVDE